MAEQGRQDLSNLVRSVVDSRMSVGIRGQVFGKTESMRVRKGRGQLESWSFFVLVS